MYKNYRNINIYVFVKHVNIARSNRLSHRILFDELLQCPTRWHEYFIDYQTTGNIIVYDSAGG